MARDYRSPGGKHYTTELPLRHPQWIRRVWGPIRLPKKRPRRAPCTKKVQKSASTLCVQSANTYCFVFAWNVNRPRIMEGTTWFEVQLRASPNYDDGSSITGGSSVRDAPGRNQREFEKTRAARLVAVVPRDFRDAAAHGRGRVAEFS